MTDESNTDLKLYRVDLEGEVYCVARSPRDAERIAGMHVDTVDYSVHASEATYVDGDWYSSFPYHAERDLPDKTCAEWLRELNGKEP